MNVTKQMEPYIYKRTKEGVHYLDLAKTWEKAMVAARIIAAVQDKNPKDVLVSSVYIGDGKSLDKTPNALMLRDQSVRYSCVCFVRLSHQDSMPSAPCSNLPPTLTPTTLVESGYQEH